MTRQTRRSLRRQILLVVVACLFLVMSSTAPVAAGTSPQGDAAAPWPTSWSPYGFSNGNPVLDVGDENPGYSDIWAGAGDSLPSVYWSSDGTNIFFRFRIRSDPFDRKGGFSSTVWLVSLGVDGTQSAVIGLDGKGSSIDYVYVTNADGSTVNQIYTTPFTNDGSGTSAGARTLSAPDEGFFIDFQVPIAQITAVAPTVTASSPIQLFFGSSQAANLSVINKDFMVGDGLSYVGLAVVQPNGEDPPTNNAPNANADSATTGQATAVTTNVLTNDSDPDGDPLTVSAFDTTSANGGTVGCTAGGACTYTPAAGFSGTDTYTYTADDGKGGTSSATVTVVVNPGNRPPDAVDDAPTVDEDGTVVVSVLANDSDPDGDPLTVTAVSNPTNGTAVINGDGTITYTPDPDFNGTDSFTYVVCDDEGQCDSATATVTVDAVNDDPVANADTVVTAEDTTVVTPVFANDADVDGDTLTVSAFDATSANGGTVSCTAAGDCTYTPPAGFSGTDTYTYTADDGNGGTTTATVTVTVVAVNDAPGAVDDTPVTAEDTPIVVPITGNDSDPEGDTLTIDFFTQPAQGSVIDNLDGTVTYTPPADWNGTTSFVYRVCDDGTPSMCDEATVTVTVTAVNDDPVANNDDAATDAGDAVVVNVLTNDTDVEADALTVSAFDATSTNGGTVSCTAAGDCTYTPPSGFSGTDRFEYTVSDGNGGTDVAEVTVVVTAVNSRPVTGPDAVTVTEDVPLDIPTSTLLSNDSDPDGPSPLTITAVTNGSHGTVTLAGGIATYTPAPDYFGADAFTYTVCDGANGCSVETVTVTVDPVNDPPVAQDDTATTDEDVPVVVDVLANDSDVEGDTLTVTAIPTAPASGTATINGDNTITYTPAANFSGVDEFEYEISDGNGGITTAWVRFIVVNPVNDAPVAVGDAATVDEDGSVTVPVVANDSDIENDDLTVVSTSAPAEGTVTINPDGSISYVPDPDYSGPDAFSYTVCDTGGLCDTAAVDVAVSAVNDEPVAVDDAAMVLEDGSVTVPVLLNDSDVEGDDLTIVSVTDPAGGTTAIVGVDVVFTPEPDFFGSVTFTYTVADGNGGSATGTVTVVVAPVNDALAYSGPTTLVLGVSATPPSLPAVDAEGDPLTYTVVGGELPPGLTLDTDGTWSGAAGQGTFEVTIEACDDQVPPACTLLPLELQVTLLADTGANPVTPLALAALLLLIGSALVLAGRSTRATFG